MFQNIKTDIIYHRTATDFEMEFNLCGCCRMRLLTDKTPDNKTFVHNLARAVSRSKIIIITGNLFGDDGIIKITSEAISKQLQVIDNNRYNINSTEEILIIKDSTPLISKDGYFGGCIIESGPQTMILLSDNKNIRKNIMQTLIHPYIADIYSAEISADTAKNVENNETDDIAAETEPQATVEEASSDEIADTQPFEEENNESEPVIEDLNAADMQNENSNQDILNDVDNSNDIDIDIGENTATDDEIQADYNSIILTDGMSYQDDTNDASPEIVYEKTFQLLAEEDSFESDNNNTEFNLFDNSGLISEDNHFEHKKQLKLDLPILIISIILLILLACICYLVIYLPLKDGVSSTEYIKDIFTTLFPN